ncbi:hypothetical protein FRB94_002825 [Tulasnella sp. JGI-2019a]|nr:hypothetical protein FRB93_013453 [Tulasnella sp. JGI-2019a]KAG8986426.1 hypothetical protein FRB94_002825 [Tulasnella sp. JGI-2019a]KAG9021914.1 hypothetical protein FRB95_001169 [Tulasnella sp. JGI-2019a]
MSPPDKMCGMVIDGDLAVSLDEGNIIPRDGEICGTLPSMPTRILTLWYDHSEVIHTPADDLESFLWVGVINALHHVKHISGPRRTLLNGRLDFDVQIVLLAKHAFQAFYRDWAKHDHFGLLFKWLEILEQEQWREAGPDMRTREDFYPLYKEMINIGISYVREQQDFPWEQME